MHISTLLCEYNDLNSLIITHFGSKQGLGIRKSWLSQRKTILSKLHDMQEIIKIKI
jgi:hypothetical protein